MNASDWVSGFFPAQLWQLYSHTGDGDFLSAATAWSTSLAGQATRTDTHDVGFMVGLPASLAYEATGAATYKNSIVTAARSLATRYDPDVGATRSWNFGSWQFPVIVDNVVNVDLLFDGASLTTSGSEQTSWRAMARSHAAVTADEHVRGNGSTYHVVDFNKTTGAVISRETHAGAGDETTWSRGQAWAIYGFTRMFANTGDQSNLDAARDVADYFINNLPADNVPYWDFDAPGIPSADKDASAAAIAASGLLELSTLTQGAESDTYFDAACDMLESLMSSTYLSNGTNSAGLVLHATGHHPRGSEVDVSTIYADYFFTEALIRYLDVAPGPDADPTVSITTPAADAIVASPATVTGFANDDLGVSQVLVSIQDQATDRYWNGTGFQLAVTNVAATLASPGTASTGWSYTFDLGASPPSSLPYVLSLKSIDSSGQVSTPSTRNFRVKDVAAPVITLIGDNPQVIPVNSAYVEFGAIATDNVDGDVTSQITIDTSLVDTASIGSYLVTYRVIDSSGNVASTTRTVNVVDVTAPTITLLGANPVVLAVGDAYDEPGATATDDVDGLISGRITIDSTAVDTSVPGGYRVTYNVADTAGNQATEEIRAVLVVGSGGPVMALSGASPQTIAVNDSYVELGADAWDDLDGDLSGSVAISGTVTTTVVGVYTMTYDVQDSEGYAAPRLTRTVRVVDTTAPVINLIGANPIVLAVGGAYSELGATAIDDIDGVITADIAITGAVNTAIAGTYPVRYNVSDTAGNSATEVIRNVHVTEPGGPLLALLGTSPQMVPLDGTYVEAGATAADHEDGDLTTAITIDTSLVNTAAIGTYDVTYSVADLDFNAVVVIRKVAVVDRTPPVLTVAGANPLVGALGDPYVEPGASALDAVDGSVGVSINDTAVDTSSPGGYRVTYDAADNAGNAADQQIRTVLVLGSGGPVMALLGSAPQTVRIDEPYVELGAAAWDDVDGDLTSAIVINASDVNTSKLGSYEVSYDVADSDGNDAPRIVRTVDVIDDVAPVITLVGSNPQSIDIRQPYVEFGATATDNVDGDLTSSIVVDSSAVDTTTSGAYVVTYDVTDAAGNVAETVSRTVRVGSDLAPDITLIGPSPQLIPFGGSYTEYGATAWDAQDGDITASLIIDASAVDVTRPGAYLVRYSVLDAGGNLSVATRPVDVVDFFVDDDTSIFQRDINAIALADITRGCNPPQNDWYCERSDVTRGQFAAMLVRALGLSAVSLNPFNDVGDSIFEADINRLHAAGITKGCNPPANTKYCPNRFLTRGEIAAMFVRALGYTDNGGGNKFDDDDGSIFEDDIDKLATAGVTRGCDPPANTQFCPNRFITRGQIAAFLARALGL
ncbi:MAG: immunoglobulin-like domain-containing protein [Acidimicrobiia bacterium]